jgi:hypothetical protein
LEKRQSIISYLLTLLLILILLKIIGIVNINNLELLSYVFIFWGLSYAFNSFGKKNRWIIFVSTVIFLIGMFMFIYSNFEIMKFSPLIIPSIFMIIGSGLLMTYIDGDQLTFVLILSLVLIASGIIITITHGEISFLSFIVSVFKIAVSYWPVLIIFFGVFLLFRKRNY